jgi:hypothetical protein
LLQLQLLPPLLPLQVGGLLLMAPEHRLSLQLKGQELWLRDGEQDRAVWAELQGLASLPFLDLLDESDELLHHRWGWAAGCGWVAWPG